MSKINMQESPIKSASAMNSSDLQHQSPGKDEKAVAEISMKEFLDFLKISYQVNEAIESPPGDIVDKTRVDWKKLTSDSFISRLKEEAVNNKEKLGKAKSEFQEKCEEVDTEKVPPDDNLRWSDSCSKSVSRENSEEKNLEKKPPFEPVSEAQLCVERAASFVTIEQKMVKRSGPPRKKMTGGKKEVNVESESLRCLEEDRTPSKLIKKKLNEVLQEGIFDSVLPYLLPKQQQQQSQENCHPCLKKYFSTHDIKKPGNAEKLEKPPVSIIKEKAEVRRKSLSKTEVLLKNEKRDIEVVIHVCDEIKNLKRDFKCSQKLLVSQMGYFAEVTSGQKLEEMDISVHCDVTIFDWLMRWVQKDGISQEHWPTLDSSIVIPVLMSSAFLQMNSLMDHCLLYCKTHINDIIRDSPNLGCISDNILTRLANLFSNREIECIVDKKDKIQSKLFCKLIAALAEPEIQPYRGHYSSIATIYRCSKCSKLILRSMSGTVYCIPSNMALNRNGVLYSNHVCDSTWNLTDYVRDLKVELKTWRNVYWRLWADCHFLFCQSCEECFPVHHMSWCRFHIEAVQYFPSENHKSVTYPIGRHPCCGERTYRFEPIKKISGCQYREHNVIPKTTSDTEILRTWNLYKEVIKNDPPQLLLQDKVKFITTKEGEVGKKSPKKDLHWWEGLELVPSKQPPGFLNKLWNTVIKKEEGSIDGNGLENRNQKSPPTKIGSVSQTSVQDLSSFSDSSDESCSSSNVGNSEESFHASAKAPSKSKPTASSKYLASTRLSVVRKEKQKKKKKKKKKNLPAKNEGNFWLSKLSTRCNQDNQRDFEEKSLRKIESILARKLTGESLRPPGSRVNFQVVPAGGIYVKLEQDWREAHCYSHGCPGSLNKTRGSSSHVAVNTTGFFVQKRSKSKGYR